MSPQLKTDIYIQQPFPMIDTPNNGVSYGLPMSYLNMRHHVPRSRVEISRSTYDTLSKGILMSHFVPAPCFNSPIEVIIEL